MRVVLDTVVLVRCLLDPFGWSGALVFERATAYEWVVSPDVVDEYLEVTKRPELVKKFRTVAGRNLDAILDRLAATLVAPTNGEAICRDPADDKFLAAAIAGSAQIIVSEDRDLLDLGTYEDLQVVTTEAFPRLLGGKS